jgi:hypothetical protein
MILHYSTRRGNQVAHYYMTAPDEMWQYDEARELYMKKARAKLAALVFETWEVEVEELHEKPDDLHERTWKSLVEWDASSTD